MKNVIPVITAAILGLIAVFVVSRMQIKSHAEREEMVAVVVATRDLSPKEVIKEGFVTSRLVPKRALPAQSILWNRLNIVLGQEVLRSVAKGDYILFNDVGMSSTLSNLVTNGEWAVPVTFSDASLLQFLQPGDEIAIWGTYSTQKVIQNKDLSDQPTVIEEKATSVLFPCVRILDIGTGDGIRREEGVRNKTIIIALPPQQAGFLIAAQRIAELYPALRHTNDTIARNRLDAGMIDDSTFAETRKGLVSVRLPAIPGFNNGGEQ